MLAAVLHDFNKLELEDVPVPEPGIGEVVVRIKSCGICATDYKAIKGIRRNVDFPLIAGHEPSGVVAAIGPGVRHFREGDAGDLPALRLLRRLPPLPRGRYALLRALRSRPAATGRRSPGPGPSPNT